MKPPLHVVAADEPPRPETVAQRVRHLQAEAQRLAADHVQGLLESMAWTTALAREIAEGGPCYHHGTQERARRIADELESQRQTLEQIVARTL